MKTAPVLYQLPVPSTSLSGPVSVILRAGEATLWFEYDKDGRHDRSGLRFTKVRAYQQRAEVHCTASHIEAAYDSLIEVTNSEWAAAIRRDTASGWKEYWSLHHYKIYIDSAGCFEVLAESWRPISGDDGVQSPH